MAISDKLTYLNETKNLLKTQINYGLPTEEQITSSTTFRNYVSSIFNAFLEALRTPDTLFTNLPKKSGTGANITLNDTANAPMRIELGATELSQSGTPTPSSPQAVHTISGSNKVVVSDGNGNSQEAEVDLKSKNLFNPYKVKAENNATLIITPTGFNITRTHGSGYGDEFIASYTIENLKANTIYTFNFDVETELNIGYGSIYVYSDNLFGTALTKSNYASSGNNHKWNITTSSNGKMVIGFYGTTSAQNKIIKLTNVQLEEGSTKTNYIEYYDYGFYGKIGNYEDKFIKTSGKNLFSGTMEQGSFNYETNANSTNSNRIRSSVFAIEPNTTYTISATKPLGEFAVYYYGKTQNALSGTLIVNTWTDYNKSFTTPNNAYYMRFRLGNNDIQFVATNNYEIMINKGQTALSYEPYGSNEWYIKKNIGKVVLDGTETWNLWTDNVYYIGNSLTTIRECLSNYYQFNTGQTAGGMSDGQFCIASSSNNYVIMFKNLSISTQADFKTWLTTHNTDLYYVLATPTYTQITGTLETQLENIYKNLLSYTGTTNINQINNDLSFNLSVSAIEEL